MVKEMDIEFNLKKTKYINLECKGTSTHIQKAYFLHNFQKYIRFLDHSKKENEYPFTLAFYRGQDLNFIKFNTFSAFADSFLKMILFLCSHIDQTTANHTTIESTVFCSLLNHMYGKKKKLYKKECIKKRINDYF